MPYSMVQFTRIFTKEHLHFLEPSEVLSQFPPGVVLKQFFPMDRLKGLTPTEIKEYLAKITKDKKD